MHMNTNRIPLGLTGGVLTLGLALFSTSTPAPAPAPVMGETFEVTITNLTSGQVLSPVLVATHEESTSLFTVGQPASPELALLAEEGDNSVLAGVLDQDPTVADVVTGTGPIPPGASETILVRATGRKRFLSVASMLVNSTDAFAGLDGFELKLRGDAHCVLPAYDAGSEFNSESCAYIPGPACGGQGAGMHDPAQAEGFVHVSSGIHGIADLAPERYDWRNPAVLVVIERARP